MTTNAEKEKAHTAAETRHDKNDSPSVGRIVHYFAAGEPGKAKGQPFAAIITHVFSDECVNLHVLGDGTFACDEARANRTSINFDATGKGGTWNWPTRK